MSDQQEMRCVCGALAVATMPDGQHKCYWHAQNWRTPPELALPPSVAAKFADPYAAYRAKEAENVKREGRGLGFDEFGFVVSAPIAALPAAALDMKPGGVVRVPGTMPEPRGRLASADSNVNALAPVRHLVVGADAKECADFICRQLPASELCRTVIACSVDDLDGVKFAPNTRFYNRGGLPGETVDAIWDVMRLQAWREPLPVMTASEIKRRQAAIKWPAMSDLPDAEYDALIKREVAKAEQEWLKAAGWTMAAPLVGEWDSSLDALIDLAEQSLAKDAKPTAPPTHPAARVRIVHDSETRMGCGTWAAMPEEPAMYGKKKPKGKGGKRGC